MFDSFVSNVYDVNTGLTNLINNALVSRYNSCTGQTLIVIQS